ncbi:MAG: T9SS type A sorting domain-containing protein [Janthinobacterium lividum]
MKHLLPFLLSALPLVTSAQTTPYWTSAVSLPTAPAFLIQPSYAVDAIGNTYLASSFAQSVTLAPGTVLTTTSQFDQDGVVAKYSPAGTLLWYRQLKGSGTETIQKVLLDASGKVMVMGTAGSGAQLGTTTFNTSNFGSTMVLGQLDANGTVQYLREVGTGTLLTPASLAADAAGNYYVSGSFALDASFGNISLSTPITATGYGIDQFVVKMSATGTPLWAQQGGRIFPTAGTSTANSYNHLVAIPGGGVYFTWTLPPTAGSFGTLTTPATKGDYDGVAVKYDALGAPQWIQRVGTANADVMTFAGLDASGRLVMPSFVAPAGSLTNPSTISTVTNGSVAVLEPTAGALVWSRDLQATTSGAYRNVTADAAGNIYLAGHFSGSATIPGKTVTGAGGIDALIVSYTSAGVLRWTQQSAGTGDEIPVTLSIDNSTGRLVIPGILTGNGLFGTTALTSTATTSGSGTPFVAFLGNVVTATRAGQAAAPLALYPNPAANTAAVTLPTLPSGTQLTVLDGLGRVARQQVAGATLPLAGLAPGLYVVQATAPGGAQWQSKLVVE